MKEQALGLAQEHGTPLFIIDHDRIRENYRTFKKHLPRVQAYYAVKANSNQEIVRTLFEEGASFDVASYNEFMQVYEYIAGFEAKEKDFYIWDKIIFSNTIKDAETLRKIRRYKPLVTYRQRGRVEEDQRALRHRRPGLAAEGPRYRLAGGDELQIRRRARRCTGLDPTGI